MTDRLSIDELQADDESCRLFMAFGTEYRVAKHYRFARFGLSLLIALVGPILSWWSLVPVGILGALPGFWLVTARLFLIPAEKRHVHRAVCIHERFDTRLFSLPWPSALAETQPSEEDIAHAAHTGLRDRRRLCQFKKGWYPSTNGLPWPVNVLEAQRASIIYGRRQHSEFAAFLGVGIGIALLSAIMIGVTVNMHLSNWLFTFLLSSPPILLDVSEFAISHHGIYSRKKSIESRIDRLWQDELSKNGTLTADACRAVQDSVFNLRLVNAQVPEWFHWFRRSRSDKNMREAASARLKQYQGANKSK